MERPCPPCDGSRWHTHLMIAIFPFTCVCVRACIRGCDTPSLLKELAANVDGQSLRNCPTFNLKEPRSWKYDDDGDDVGAACTRLKKRRSPLDRVGRNHDEVLVRARLPLWTAVAPSGDRCQGWNTFYGYTYLPTYVPARCCPSACLCLRLDFVRAANVVLLGMKELGRNSVGIRVKSSFSAG